MKISEKYGPQFDETDGTVGKTQLVKRWAVIKEDGFMFASQQGRNTRATKEEAERDLANIIANNPAELVPFGLTVGALWCWPVHFDPVGTAPDYEKLAHEIMENYPEYSFCVRCTGWDYDKGLYDFIDEEDGKHYQVTETQIAEALPKLRALIADEKLFFDGLHSGAESFMEGGNWDSISTDAAVQIVLFGEVIYG